MKINHDLFFIPSIMVSMFGFYNIYKLHKKIKEIEQDTEIILKTHNRYMEVQEKQHEAIMKQHEAIKDLYNSIEGIACTLPFTSKHEWQNKMIERKFQREPF
jgi:predicted nucleotide-binding protein (sugar kinase/HSP70/actin superfamily)